MNEKCKSTDGLFEYVAPPVEKLQRKRKLPGGKIAPRDLFYGKNLKGMILANTKNGCPSMTPAIYDALNALDDAINALQHAAVQSFPMPIMEEKCSPADYARGCAFLRREFLDQREAVRFYIWRLQHDVAETLESKLTDLNNETISVLLNSGMAREYLTVNWSKLEKATD